jgi:hypothetical protein
MDSIGEHVFSYLKMVIKSLKDCEAYITQYYQGMFGPSDCEDFQLTESQYDEMPQVSSEEKEILTSEFTEKEVK